VKEQSKTRSRKSVDTCDRSFEFWWRACERVPDRCRFRDLSNPMRPFRFQEQSQCGQMDNPVRRIQIIRRTLCAHEAQRNDSEEQS